MGKLETPGGPQKSAAGPKPQVIWGEHGQTSQQAKQFRCGFKEKKVWSLALAAEGKRGKTGVISCPSRQGLQKGGGFRSWAPRQGPDPKKMPSGRTGISKYKNTQHGQPVSCWTRLWSSKAQAVRCVATYWQRRKSPESPAM